MKYFIKPIISTIPFFLFLITSCSSTLINYKVRYEVTSDPACDVDISITNPEGRTDTFTINGAWSKEYIFKVDCGDSMIISETAVIDEAFPVTVTVSIFIDGKRKSAQSATNTNMSVTASTEIEKDLEYCDSVSFWY
jgi:hypothetical protein